MNLPLSSRLQVCAGFVSPGERVADIGCDHGYLGIYLLQKGIARSVIAADINEGPLQSAVRNAEKFGVSENISFYLSDGARNIPRDFDTLICAGMGGDTMVHILQCAPWLNNEKYRLILQCQSKTPVLRRYLSENGWRIAEESVLRDGKFLYTVMEVWYQPDYPRLTVGEWLQCAEHTGRDLQILMAVDQNGSTVLAKAPQQPCRKGIGLPFQLGKRQGLFAVKKGNSIGFGKFRKRFQKKHGLSSRR